MIRLGGKIPSIQPSGDPVEMARAYREFGYRAAMCPKVSINEMDRIAQIKKAYADEDVLIAEVGAWSNLVSPDDEERKRNIAFVCERLALADELGALCCVDFIGSVAPNAKTKFAPHPDNLNSSAFDLCVETIRKVVDEVKPKRSKFCLEMMQWTLPDSPEVYLELIEAVDRPAFGAHLDPANIILTPRQYFNSGELIKKCFQLLGPWIVSCHAKDLILRDQLALHLDEIRPGQGNMNYKTYLTELNKLPGDVPIMLEHLSSDEEYGKARDHLFSIGMETGVVFKGK